MSEVVRERKGRREVEDWWERIVVRRIVREGARGWKGRRVERSPKRCREEVRRDESK